MLSSRKEDQHSFTPGRIGYASGKLPKNRLLGQVIFVNGYDFLDEW
jgi:hypothetical protein